MKFLHIALGVCVLLVASIFVWFQTQDTEAPRASYDTLELRDALVRIEVVTTPEERQRGLSGRARLEEGTGMFFVFPNSDYMGIWMPDMLFSIDVLWLDETLRVAYIVENMSPQSYPKIFYPTKPARFILEVPAGFVRAHGMKVGDQARLQLADS